MVKKEEITEGDGGRPILNVCRGRHCWAASRFTLQKVARPLESEVPIRACRGRGELQTRGLLQGRSKETSIPWKPTPTEWLAISSGRLSKIFFLIIGVSERQQRKQRR